MCNHCDNAPCIAKSDGVITKRADGIVLIDQERAKGRKDLVDACPYGHIWWNEELGVPQHWPFDAHLIDQGWQQTRGQQSCPTGAMRAVQLEDDEMARMAREQGFEVMRPELGSKPRVYYRNLWRYSTCFIGGSISTEVNGAIDCVEGASVKLLQGGKVVAETTTDNYGDFKLDKLKENSGAYVVEIAKGGKTKRVDAKLGESINLGEIRLSLASCLNFSRHWRPGPRRSCACPAGLRWCRMGCAIPSGSFPRRACAPITLPSLPSSSIMTAIAPAGFGRPRSRSRSSSAGRCWRSVCSRARPRLRSSFSWSCRTTSAGASAAISGTGRASNTR